MSEQHSFAFAQGTLYGDDERVLNQAQIVDNVLDAMPPGLDYDQFRWIADILCFKYYSAWRRMISIVVTNEKEPLEKLALMMSAVTGDLPNPETIARTRRKLMEHGAKHANKTALIREVTYKPQKRKQQQKKKRYGQNH